MGNEAEISALIAELDAKRTAMGMSYQDVADSCDVSKATVYRALSGQTQPTIQLVKNIAAAVQYKEKREDILPDELTQEAYITYLKQLLKSHEEDTEMRVNQLHAHYNKQRRRDKRSALVWEILAIMLILAFVALFLYDFAHLDRGWIQAMSSRSITGTGTSMIGKVSLAFRK